MVGRRRGHGCAVMGCEYAVAGGGTGARRHDAGADFVHFDVQVEGLVSELSGFGMLV